MPEGRPFEKYTIRPRAELDTPCFFQPVFVFWGAINPREFNSAIDPFDDGLRSTCQVSFFHTPRRPCFH